MADSTGDSQKYMQVMKQTRRRRKYFFATVLLYIPAILIAYRISPTNRTMGTLFALWVAVLIIVTFLVALSKCPRCGNYFHLHGMTLLVLRKCLHCQLHINESVQQEPGREISAPELSAERNTEVPAATKIRLKAECPEGALPLNNGLNADGGEPRG